jgi:hypothetical protein
MIYVINAVIIATAFATITQYILYYSLGIVVGIWTFYPTRNVADLLFSGYSVLSLFLSVGFIINIKKFYEESKLRYILGSLICLIAITVNSARTGMAVSLIIYIYIYLTHFFKSKKNLMISITTAPFLLAIIIFLTARQLNNRSTVSLFDENGRFETYSYGFSLLSGSIRGFLFGSGLSLDNYTETVPHNFFFELVVNTGVLAGGALICMLALLLRYINSYEYKYIIWGILIGSMFITNFQGNGFATVLIIIAILSTELSNMPKPDINKIKISRAMYVRRVE